MPIFMDRHDIAGVTAKQVAEAHQKDLKIQHKFGCEGLTYWFDEKNGVVFCLIRAPHKNAVIQMHEASHGMIPHQVIEVESEIVNAFLGRISDPKIPGTSELVINESAIRTIMFIEVRSDKSFNRKLTNKKMTELTLNCRELIHLTLQQNGSGKTEDTDDGFIAAFTSESKAISCAKEILAKFNDYYRDFPGTKMKISIGLSTGAPVTNENDFFGKAIRKARRLCYIAGSGEILLSSSMNNPYSDESNIKSMNPDEEKFLDQLMDITDKCWNHAGFRVRDYYEQISLSKAQFYRKIISLTQQSPNEFLRDFRLRKALKLIKKQNGNISEVAFESGFNNPSYFTQCFHRRFGILPSEYETLMS